MRLHAKAGDDGDHGVHEKTGGGFGLTEFPIPSFGSFCLSLDGSAKVISSALLEIARDGMEETVLVRAAMDRAMRLSDMMLKWK